MRANLDGRANIRILETQCNARQAPIMKANLDGGANTRKFRTFRNPFSYKPSRDNESHPRTEATPANSELLEIQSRKSQAPIVRVSLDHGAKNRKFRTFGNRLS